MARVTFTTESEEAERSRRPDPVYRRTADPFQVYLRPNPAADRVEVSISSGALNSVQVMDNHGRTVRRLPAAGPVAAVDLTGLPAGVYWVRTVRTDGAQLTVYLVKR